ncbi:MAG: ATP-binding protein [Halobacteriales archaeon]|nr:ATP-binding protein [Halobacteriales archaeon]
MNETIGWALGPGRTEEAFDFVAQDMRKLKTGEFVYYEPPGREGTKILCRVRERERIVSEETDIPSTLEPHVEGEVMATLRSNRAYRVTAKVLGFYDREMGSFRNLRNPPEMGQEVYYAGDELLSEILMPSKDTGILHVGRVLNRDKTEVDVVIDMDEIATKHLSVLAATGAGKSYTVGVLLEEMVKPGNRGTSVVFDLHGEYFTLAEDEEYGDRFNLIEEPRIKISNLEIDDFQVAFTEKATNVQIERLREVLSDLDIRDSTAKPSKTVPQEYQDTVRIDYSIDDVIDRLKEGNRVDDNLSWRLGMLNDFVSLDAETETSVKDLCEPGKCNIIEFPTGAGELERNLILWYYTKQILESRKEAMRVKRGRNAYEAETEEGMIKVPVTIFIEEAHNFAPVERDLKTRDILQEIAREGRKFGVGLCIVSQRPSRLDEDVLSQCNSSIIMKVRNGVDQQTIERSVEAAGEDLLRDLPGLTTGQAVLAGDFINTPVLTKVRERETEHGGMTPDVAEESIAAYEESQKRKKERHERAAQKAREARGESPSQD